MLADLLLAYLCAGLAASMIVATRLLRRLATPRTPERREMLRALHDDGLPHWLCAVLFFGAVVSVLAQIALFWPSRIERILEGGW